MKFALLLVLLSLAAPLVSRGEAACCSGHDEKTPAAPAVSGDTSSAASPEATRGHPLKGVVIAVLTEKSALLVKHEEIPGVMKAMTMLLKVDAATLAAAKKDQAITGTLVQKPDGWWLLDLQPAPASE